MVRKEDEGGDSQLTEKQTGNKDTQVMQRKTGHEIM
jgi:hypothetical protein